MAEYCPGEWYGVITKAGSALLPQSVPLETVKQVRLELQKGRGIGAVIDGLVGAFGASLSQLPPFAVLLVEPGGAARVALRGAIEARIAQSGSAEPVVVSGVGVSTWNERHLDAAQWAELCLPGALGDLVFPLTDGIVLAGRLRLVATEQVPADGHIEDAEALSSASELLIGAGFAGGADAPSSPDESASRPEVAESPEPELDAVELDAAEPADVAAEPVPDAVDDPRRAATVAAEAVPTEYDQLLFGETVLSSVESAAVRSTAADEPDVSPTAGTSGSLSPERTAVSPGSPDIVSTAGLISAVPTAHRAGWDDHDGETIMVDQLLAQASSSAPASAASAPRAVPTLLVPGRSPILLDRPVVIGTRPKFSRVQGGNVPTLVTVDSPNSEISRSHIELRREGAEILAVDLNSTNGTVLLRVGADPVRLQPREAYLLVEGDQLDLGDGVVLSFEELA